jgi:single-stranded-DNA-specific exonuclease
MRESSEWQIQPATQPPEWLLAAIRPYLSESSGQYAAQLLWQRGIRQPEQLPGFIDPCQYQPTSPFAFGPELEWAIARLQKAVHSSEKVTIWGDFDADGITATTVLWEGLGEFFPRGQLTYYIPNRLTESHGLSKSKIAALVSEGCSLIITCDTGSTNLAELLYAQRLGIDVIITDHHTLPLERPPVTAILNPRAFPANHPLANLSGVAVAYKLVEALYVTLPDVPQRPLTALLDLVAIGLIADLVMLTGDCRYLAQMGITRLQKNQDPIDPPRPGIAKLLELCRRSGDRPTDIAFGLGPRINAISRIHGDAQFCVELLTSRDRERCHQLAVETELANARRKVLQRQVVQQVKEKLAQLDLSTTQVIVLADPQWSVGVLGLVAGQIAQEYGRPTILLSTEEQEATATSLARGSARSVNQIDLYALLQQQAHLLHRFGGHPLALGLSLPTENIPILTQALNQQVGLLNAGTLNKPRIEADLTVTVVELGQALFQELKLLEPYGIGNSVPKLLIRNCWFTKPWHRKLQDLQGRKLEYIKTEFTICDDSCPQGFPGVWWGHYKDELPIGCCDAVVELDFNSYEDAKRKKRYEVRLVAVRACDAGAISTKGEPQRILDWRGKMNANLTAAEPVLVVSVCPSSWAELYAWIRQAQQSQRSLALAYDVPVMQAPESIWQQLLDQANQLSQTTTATTKNQLQEKLGLGQRSLEIGLAALKWIGFEVIKTQQEIKIFGQGMTTASGEQATEAIEQFLSAVRQEQFMRQFFCQVPLVTIQATIAQEENREAGMLR